MAATGRVCAVTQLSHRSACRPSLGPPIASVANRLTSAKPTRSCRRRLPVRKTATLDEPRHPPLLAKSAALVREAGEELGRECGLNAGCPSQVRPSLYRKGMLRL